MGNDEDEGRRERRDAVGEPQGTANGPEVLFIRENGYVFPLHLDELVWAKAEDNYVRLGTPRGEFLIRRALSDLEQQLGASPMVRIHRSSMVNLRYVRRLVPWFSGGYVVQLTTGEEFKLSKGYAADLFERYGSP